MLNDLIKEVNYRTSRSSGAGGQHVNKVSTKVELLFDVNKSNILSDDEKAIVASKLKNRISLEGILMMQCDESRSQIRNKEIVNIRFLKLIEEALKPVKKRKPTKPKKSAVEKRITNKKRISEKKERRKTPE